MQLSKIKILFNNFVFFQMNTNKLERWAAKVCAPTSHHLNYNKKCGPHVTTLKFKQHRHSAKLASTWWYHKNTNNINISFIIMTTLEHWPTTFQAAQRSFARSLTCAKLCASLRSVFVFLINYTYLQQLLNYHKI